MRRTANLTNEQLALRMCELRNRRDTLAQEQLPSEKPVGVRPIGSYATDYGPSRRPLRVDEFKR